MIGKYTDEDLLMLSGIQHIAFCERQWALIHIEQTWQENVRTVEGQLLHERSDDPFMDETRGQVRTVRAMPIVSYSLGLIGRADVVEFRMQSIKDQWYSLILEGREGFWRVSPVEYKRGKSKKDDRDIVQLCAQALCLEEMLEIQIQYGELYYAQTRHRERIEFDQSLRTRVMLLAEKMHDMFEKGFTPRATTGKHCSLCSLVEECQPRMTSKQRSVKNYINSVLDGLNEGE